MAQSRSSKKPIVSKAKPAAQTAQLPAGPRRRSPVPVTQLTPEQIVGDAPVPTELGKAARPSGANTIDLSTQARAWMSLMQAARNPARANPAQQRLTSYYSPAFEGNGLFAPGEPIMPTNPEIEPREFQYRPGINLMYIPRAGYNVSDFQTLRNLASNCREIRLNIEHIKRYIRGLEWDVVPIKESPVHAMGRTFVASPETADVENFFNRPDGLYDWDAWVNMVLEEILVTDAMTLWPSRDPSNGQFILEVVDGTTIRPLTDFHGRIPRPPDPAYLQVLWGYPTSWFPADRIIYRPLNTKVYTPYGESPQEWVLAGINIAIRRELQKISYFTDGNIPYGALGLPSEWTIDQIKEFTDYIDALFSGDLARIFRFLPIPHDTGAIPWVNFQQHDLDKTQLDEFLMTIACWAFGNSPAEFGITGGGGRGLGSAGFMQAQENTQYRSMIGPITKLLMRLGTFVIQTYLGHPELKFKFVGMEESEDVVKQSQADDLYITAGVYTTAFVQDRLGIDPAYRPAQKPTPVTLPPEYQNLMNQGRASGSFGGGAGGQQFGKVARPFVQRAIQADMAAWRERAIRFSKRGWKQETYRTEVIPEEMAKVIFDQIDRSKSPEEIANIFEISEQVILDPVVMEKIGEPVPDRDPGGHIKYVAENELRRAMLDYLTGLRDRIVKATQTSA